MTIVGELRVAELSEREAASIARAHPGLGDTDPILAVRVPAGVDPAAFTAALRRVAEMAGTHGGTLAEHAQHRAFQRLLDALAPGIPGPGLTAQARRNVQLRTALADEFGLPDSAAVAALAGSTARNAAATAARWKARRDIFAVTIGDRDRFPGFQFDPVSGRPRAVIAEVLAELQPVMGAWSIALWFLGANGWLGGQRPVDVLEADPDQVRQAAHQLTEYAAGE